MKLYYVLEIREKYESCTPLYITSNKEKAITWWSMNTDEVLCYFIASKNQIFDDEYCKCDLTDDNRQNNYFAGLWKYINSMDHNDFVEKYCIDYIDKDPEIIDLDELQKDDNVYNIKFFN